MSKNWKILLVDDDEAFLKANSLLLKNAGYDVLTAQDGRAGLAAAKEHKPDMVILDVIMGRPDAGFVLARAIRADRELEGTKVILLTAAGEHYQMLFEPDPQWLPVDKVLEKPIPPEDLLAEIARLLGVRATDVEDHT